MLANFGVCVLFASCDVSICGVALERAGGVVGPSDLVSLEVGQAIVLRLGYPPLSVKMPMLQDLADRIGVGGLVQAGLRNSGVREGLASQLSRRAGQ